MPINGTPGNDIIDGTASADDIFGLGGNDTINGLGGNDTIYGGTGDDILNGGDGDDLFVQDDASSFSDVFNGGAGTDTIELRIVANPIVSQFGLLSQHANLNPTAFSSIERLVFASQPGSAVSYVIQLDAVAASGLTTMVGGSGRDLPILFTGTAGSFTVPTLTYSGFTAAATNAWEGSPDSDAIVLVSGAAAGSTVTLNAANGLAATQLLVGGDGNDTLNGSANGDFLDGAGGTNQLNGNGGNDALAIINQSRPNGGGFGPPTTFSGAGSTFDGGSGTDALVIGGVVDLQATLVNIEGVFLEAAFIPPVANTVKQDAAVLILDTAHLAMLPGNVFFGGTGTVILDRDDNASYSLASFTIAPGSTVEFGILGGDGNALTFTGNSGDNTIVLGTGDQTAIGGGGDDILVSDGGVDQLFGGDGDDSLVIAGQALAGGTYDGGAGTDTLVVNNYYVGNGTSPYGPSSTQVLFGANQSSITGIEQVQFNSDFNSLLVTSIRADLLPGSGITELIGGAGTDSFVSYVTAGGSYTMANYALVNWTGEDALILYTDPALIADVTLNAASLAVKQVLIGAGGNDTLNGAGGNDTFDGHAGADRMTGFGGNDTYLVDTQADLVFEQAAGGSDTVVASTGFYLYDNIETLVLFAGAGDIYGVGNGLDNLLIGNEGVNLLLGGAGNDTVNGAAGNDVLYGEDGADTLNGGDGVDFLAGGLGNDQLRGDNGADALFGEDGDDTLDGGNSFDTDILVGGAGNDTLDGVSGQANPDYDLMDGGAGNDTYQVDTGADLTFEAAGAGGGIDTVYANVTVPNAGVYLYANVENLVLQGTTAFGVGNELDNNLTGSASGNWLLGGAGNDRITGGAGNDVLFGEGGADTFVFGAGSGQDVIGGFAIAEDKIELNGIYTSFAQTQAHMVQVGGDMAIDLGGGNFIVLLGVDKANLSAANFIFTAGAAAPPPVKGAFAESGFDDWALAHHQQVLV